MTGGGGVRLIAHRKKTPGEASEHQYRWQKLVGSFITRKWRPRARETSPSRKTATCKMGQERQATKDENDKGTRQTSTPIK